MCVKLTAEQRFIRRRDAAIEYMKGLLDQDLSDQSAIESTSDTFSLNADSRDDYRIYKALWNLIEG